MKTTNVKTAKNGLSQLLRDAQLEHVVILNHGRPAAVVIGIAGHEIGDVLGMSEDLTQLMVRHAKTAAAKRPERAVTQEEMERRYARKPPRPAPTRHPKRAA